jgi:hypothetical protein
MFLIILDWQNIANSFIFVAQKLGSMIRVTRIICLLLFFEEFLRHLGPSFRCWKFLHDKKQKQTLSKLFFLHIIRLASWGGPTNAPPCLLAFGAMLPHCLFGLLYVFHFLLSRWGTTTITTTMTLLHLMSRPNVCLFVVGRFGRTSTLCVNMK